MNKWNDKTITLGLSYKNNKLLIIIHDKTTLMQGIRL